MRVDWSVYVFVVVAVSYTGEWVYEVLRLLDFRRLCFIEVEGLIIVRQKT